VPSLHFAAVQPDGEEAVLLDWQRVHNLIIPVSPLSAGQARERARRNHLEVAYREGIAVGCSTVRPPADDPETATVIARVLPGHRRRGLGEQLYQRALARARDLGAQVIDTVVLASNEDGLRFARRHGFAETERYVLPGQDIPFVDLRLAPIDKIAWIRLKDGKILSTRSRGKDACYIPGGKRERGESDLQALTREVREELDVAIVPGSVAYAGTFQAQAHGHPAGVTVRMTCYTADYQGTLTPSSEVAELYWLSYADRGRVSPVDRVIFDHLYRGGQLS
jgi:GNAT superfamily N-acetyltransferase/ADP-ribose pyrophosphatase YjhB (NUDIX family)